MAGKGKQSKKKGKGKGGRKRLDESQLRRQLRDRAREIELDDEDEGMPKVDLSQYAEQIRIGGIEGGGTHSTLMIIDGEGKPLTEVNGPQTNHWGLGMEETAARIAAMVQRGKENLDIPESLPLECLGLSISGCEEENINRQLVEILQEKYPDLAKDYVVTSDTLGSLRTGVDNGGIVLIAGTGSNALLINSDGKVSSCGGWGHMMGDEGSAYWIAHRACKIVFDDIDGLIPAPKPISYLWPAIRQFFNLTERTEILPHIYTNFDKSQFATFTKEVVTGCENEDPLSLYLLQESGKYLAKHIIALSSKAHNDLKLSQGGLKIICVGSVFKSWKYMRDAFIDEIHESRTIDELTMYRLTASAALGACYLAAEKINCLFPKPYQDNVEVFNYYKRDNYVKTETVDETESKVYLVPCNSMNAKEN